MTLLYLLFFLLGLWFGTAAASLVGQQCDWTGSGLSGGEKRGVRPVYLRCGEGRVTWSYPEGALRVLLRAGSSGREFRACLKPRPSLAGSIYLEAPRSLIKLYSPNSDTRIRCFQSRGGQAALYVESSGPPNSAAKQAAEFAYHLQPLPKGKGYDPNEECRPCTKEEMIHAFCTSELVARGIVQRVQPTEEEDLSEIHLKVKEVLRSSSRLENDIEETADISQEGVAIVGVPRHCGAGHGAGQLVVMARRKLGQLTLVCAPRHAEWAALIARPSVRDAAHCLLKS